jgi:hypothetical protein
MSHLRKIAADLGKSQIKQDKVLIRLILTGWFVFWIGLWWIGRSV